MIDKQLKVTTTKECTLRLNAADVCAILRAAIRNLHLQRDVSSLDGGHVPPAANYLEQLFKQLGEEVPINARVTFTVPGDGDYSGTSIPIDDESPLWVRWTVVTTG